jgi:membrane protease subunit (stomatin/prohibitin family)
MPLTYRQLLRATRSMARDVRRATETHKKMAAAMEAEARDTGRIAEQIAALKVDTATVSETREVARIMRGLSTTALAYANAADEASIAAKAAEQQTITDHSGIQEAADRSPVPMADRTWYRQE